MKGRNLGAGRCNVTSRCLIGLVLAAALSYLSIAPAAAWPILTLDPSAGPCDTTVTAIGEGFAPGEPVELRLGKPSSDARGELLTIVTRMLPGPSGLRLPSESSAAYTQTARSTQNTPLACLQTRPAGRMT